MLPNEVVSSTRSVSELLRVDHRRLDYLLADVKCALAAGDIERAAARFAHFRAGLERHITAEEEVLFPAFEARFSGAIDGPIYLMQAEHAEIQRLMAEVAVSLERRSAGSHTTPLAALTARIYAHNGKEERILYPAMDRAGIGAVAGEELVRRIEGVAKSVP